MAERRSPAGELAGAMAAASGPAVALRELPFLAQVNVRTALPEPPGAVAQVRGRTALWLGPDEWLVVGADGEQGEIERAFADALSVVDVSGQRTTLELRGPRAREVLEKGCSLDLHPWRFSAGRCAQTLLARADVVLWQVDDEPGYRLLVGCSFAPYLVHWLLDAMREFGEVAA
jgi:sarcosine oxidase subunit gamma